MSENEVVEAEALSQSGLFEVATGWVHASTDECKKLDVFPNLLAYHEASATLVLIVQKSMKGTDYALGAAGLEYLEEIGRKGTMASGAVRRCIVVLADFDTRRAGSRRALRVVKSFTLPEMRDQVSGLDLMSGGWGDFWWVTAGSATPSEGAGRFARAKD